MKQRLRGFAYSPSSYSRSHDEKLPYLDRLRVGDLVDDGGREQAVIDGARLVQPHVHLAWRRRHGEAHLCPELP